MALNIVDKIEAVSKQVDKIDNFFVRHWVRGLLMLAGLTAVMLPFAGLVILWNTASVETKQLGMWVLLALFIPFFSSIWVEIHP